MNYDYVNNNKVQLSGKIASDPVFSHELYGEGFYEFLLEVPRLSDYKDLIPVTISERLLSKDTSVGSEVSVKGQFRSYNKIENEKSRLLLTVFAREICEFDPTIDPNIIEISGFICKEPNYRTTPFNREICDILIAANRAYNKSDYLPAIAWGRNARFAKNFNVGEKLFVSGRIQSREYQKKISETETETKTAYEISVGKISLVTELNEDESNALIKEGELIQEEALMIEENLIKEKNKNKSADTTSLEI